MPPLLRTVGRALAVALLLALPAAAHAAKADILLPLGRNAYQTNEWIDVSVVRGDDQALKAGDLVLTLDGADGSKLSYTFPVKAGGKQATEHLHLNAALLRPGKYTLDVAVDGAKATADLEIFSHLRKSDFRLINWGRARGKDQLVQGEDSLGFNLFYGNPGSDDAGNFLRAGVDFMSNCTMGGGHQMDLRQECDWSDPYVTRGGTVRVARRAMQDRRYGNVPGVHFYDEPGLTWRALGKDEQTPHGIPSQVRSYLAAFGKEPIDFTKVDPKNPEDVKAWRQWATWKLSFMDAAWKEAQFGVGMVRPDYLSLTQSQYGWSAFTDGYYFNVARSLPVNSGHGGYDDFGPGYFNPSYFLEMARARDFDKAEWYLPQWYGNQSPDRFRLEQYLSFMTSVQGMMSPPDLEPATNPSARQGIVESNHLMQRLGPIFTTAPVTRPPVALLYSLSQAIHTQTGDMTANYAHGLPHGQNLPLVYLAGKMVQQQFMAVVEEDILDGTLANEHKAVILTSLDYLDPKVIAALEEYAAGGGSVLMTGDCTVMVKGAKKLPVKPAMPDQAKIDELMKAKKYGDLGPYTTTGKWFEGAAPLAKAIKAELDKIGVKPPLESDVPSIVVTRQQAGEIEYIFAVNATYDGSKGEKNALKATTAKLRLPRPTPGDKVFDALVGGAVTEFTKQADGSLAGEFRFGPGQMRVFARTVLPPGGVKIAAPVVHRDLTRDKDPIRLEIAATLLSAPGLVLGGSAPLHVQVIDPFGVVRHDLYRATKLGQFQATLPLAANDPSGTWAVSVEDPIFKSSSATSFRYDAPARAASLAGATPRAVSFGNDRENIFRFARLHRSVTIVKGTASYHTAAAERLVKILDPWGVKCQVTDVATAGKARTLTDDEYKTWIGLHPGRLERGSGNSPAQVGFAVQGDVILLGNPEDNAIIKYLGENQFLPYAPKAGVFPGAGRGMIAWQRDGVGHGQESVTLIAHDAEGLSEAVGSFYEAVVGLDPLTKYVLPEKDALVKAKTAGGRPPRAPHAWIANLPDRVEAIKVGKGELTVLTHDGTLATVSAAGKVTDTKTVGPADVEAKRKELTAADADADAEAKKQARPDRMLKLAAKDGDRLAVGYWGGTLRTVEGGKVTSETQLPQDVTALAWLDGQPVAGLASGQVVLLDLKFVHAMRK
jgi:hypothetical protein